MFRPELLDVDTSPASSHRVFLFVAAVLMGAEFFFVFICSLVLLGRADDIGVETIPVVLCPLIVYDCVTITFCGFIYYKQRDLLLPSERALRIFYLLSLVARFICVLVVCICCARLWSVFRGFLLLVAFGGNYIGLLMLNSNGPRSGYVRLKVQIWDLSILALVVQIWIRYEEYVHVNWGFMFWQVFLLSGIGMLFGFLGCMGATSYSLRAFFQILAAAGVALFWGTRELTLYLDDLSLQDPTQRRSPVLFERLYCIASALLFVLFCVMGKTYVDHRMEDDDDYVSLGNGGADGPPLHRDESIFLEALSTSFYRSVTDLPTKVVDYFRKINPSNQSTNAVDDGELVNLRSFSFDTCDICCDHEADAVFLHCGHGGVCHQCASFLFHRSGECCICRSPVQGVAKITHKNFVTERNTNSSTDGESMSSRTSRESPAPSSTALGGEKITKKQHPPIKGSKESTPRVPSALRTKEQPDNGNGRTSREQPGDLSGALVESNQASAAPRRNRGRRKNDLRHDKAPAKHDEGQEMDEIVREEEREEEEEEDEHDKRKRKRKSKEDEEEDLEKGKGGEGTVDGERKGHKPPRPTYVKATTLMSRSTR